MFSIGGDLMKYAYIFILMILITLSGCEFKNEKIDEKQNKSLAKEEMTEQPVKEEKTEAPKQEEKMLISKLIDNMK